MFNIRVRKTRVDDINGFLIGIGEDQYSTDPFSMYMGDIAFHHIRFYQDNEMDLLEKRFKNLLIKLEG